MTQSLSKRKFLAAKLGDRRRDGGNTTSVAAALTRARQARLPSPWTRERDLKWKPEKEAKNSQTRRMTAWKTCRLIRLTHCSSRVVTPRHPGFSPRRRVAFENDRHQDISNSSQNRVVNRLPMLAGGAVGVVGGV